jgi:CRISPR-associated protein Cmr2
MLITLSLGPVQSLIEAARRTRDLWGGSWLLSEVSRAAARELHRAQPGSLIFPCPDNPDVDLKPLEHPGDEANIANILRAEAELPDSDAARALCEQAKTAARERLIEIGDQARGELSFDLRADVWNAQIGDLLEVFAAWAEIPAGDDGYQQASRQLGATLAARKATRDFIPAACAQPDLPKSSLDGAFETVLPHPDTWPEHHRDRRKLGLSRGEQLDALGVIKRRAGDVDQFTAYSRIAADPWIETLQAQHPDALAALNAAYEPLVRAQLATRVRGNEQLYQAMPYDAQLLYGFRLEAAIGGKGEDRPDTEDETALRQLQQALRDLPKAASAPVPYAAILKADGDRMGKLLKQARSADDSRRISRALHGFASEVRAIVRDHRGHAIYAGGDDVLALVPLPNAVRCAGALASAFAEAMQPVARKLRVAEDALPTLSAGIAIGHLMEPLGSLRARAGAAEHLAKGDHLANAARDGESRNALAIVLGIRSGGELAWRANWTQHARFEALEQFIDAYRDNQLPSRVAYDLRAIDQRLQGLKRLAAADAAAAMPQDHAMRAAEVARTLDRARTTGGSEPLGAAIQHLIQEQVGQQPLAELANTLILARWLAARNAADLGDRGQ